MSLDKMAVLIRETLVEIKLEATYGYNNQLQTIKEAGLYQSLSFEKFEVC